MPGTATLVDHLPAAPESAAPRAAWAAIRACAIYAAIAAAVAGAWLFVRLTGLKAASPAGYWLGVAGGVTMLLLFAYPLRKRLRIMSRWGAAKWWFGVHMVLGLGGPLLVLVHSTFQVGSLNAGVALYSMLIVGASGVVGRFLYLQVHGSLHGERRSLAQLQHALGLQHCSMHSALASRQKVEAVLLQFEHDSLGGPTTLSRQLAAFFVLPVRRRWTRTHCARELRRQLRRQARGGGPEAMAAARREYRVEADAMDAYLQAVVRTAQYQSAVRLFSLWHVLHVPFVYVMVLCALAHVVAVHAY